MISMIAAVYNDLAIGKDNQLPAYIKPDLQYFKKVTEGHPVVMGYNTYLSLPVKPLLGRKNIVITRKNVSLEGITVVHSIEEVIALAETELKDKEIFIIGGASIYEQFMPHADKLYITHVFRSLEADTFFPAIDDTWKLTKVHCERENIEHPYSHIFTIYEKE